MPHTKKCCFPKCTPEEKKRIQGEFNRDIAYKKKNKKVTLPHAQA